MAPPSTSQSANWRLRQSAQRGLSFVAMSLTRFRRLSRARMSPSPRAISSSPPVSGVPQPSAAVVPAPPEPGVGGDLDVRRFAGRPPRPRSSRPAVRVGPSSAGWKYTCTTSRLSRSPVLVTVTRTVGLVRAGDDLRVGVLPGGVAQAVAEPERRSRGSSGEVAAVTDGGALVVAERTVGGHDLPGRSRPVGGRERRHQPAGRLDLAQQRGGHGVPGLLARQPGPDDGVDLIGPGHQHRGGGVDHDHGPRGRLGHGAAPARPGRRAGRWSTCRRPRSPAPRSARRPPRRRRPRPPPPERRQGSPPSAGPPGGRRG